MIAALLAVNAYKVVGSLFLATLLYMVLVWELD